MGISQVTINSPTQFFPTRSFFSMSSSPHRNINTRLSLVTGPFWPLWYISGTLSSTLHFALGLLHWLFSLDAPPSEVCRVHSLISSNPLLRYHLLSEAGLNPYFKWHPCIAPLPSQSPLSCFFFLFFPHSTDHLWTCYVIFLFITFIIHCLLFLHQVPWSQNLPCLWSLIYPKCLVHSWHMLGNICWISRWLFYAESQCPKQRKAEPLWLKQRKRAKTPGYS